MKKKLSVFTAILFFAALIVEVSVSPNGQVHFINKAAALQRNYYPVIGQCIDVDGTVYSGGVSCEAGSQVTCTPEPCVPL